MMTEFLDVVRAAMDGEEKFDPRPWYNRYSGCIVYHASEEMDYAEEIDSVLTVYRSVDSDEVIGCQLNVSGGR